MTRIEIPNLVSAMALLWGAVVFFPVGVHYLAMLLLLAAMGVDRRYRERYERIRSSGILWLALGFVGWTLLIVTLQGTMFPETPSHLLHGIRIALTLLLAASLSREEASSALKGLALGFTFVLIWLGGYFAGVLPTTDFWEHFTSPTNNKSIGASILFSFAAVSFVAISVEKRKWGQAATLLGFALSVVVIVVVLGKRTAMLGVFIGLVALLLHYWRNSPKRLLAGVLVLMLATVTAYSTVPTVQDRIGQGVREVHGAMEGKVALESWNIRVQMIRHTTDMMIEKPWLGWGIGSWNTQWHQRAPESMTGFNMPHNDFLWMGAQAGVPGALAWLALLLGVCWRGWKTHSIAGQLTFAIGAMAIFSSLVNNGTRDAGLGFPMLWVLGVMLASCAEKQAPRA